MNFHAEKVLVTGGAGFIGTHLCRALFTEGHDVYSLDLKEEGSTPEPFIKYIRGDARDLARVLGLLNVHEITTVYHLAATVSVPVCQNDPLESYSNNVNATLTILEACRLYSKPVKVAFASSAALYGNLGDNHLPLGEAKVADRFSSFYAAQKHASEKLIELYKSVFGIPALIFRFFNVYGQGQDPSSPYSGVITVFSKLAKENRALLLDNAGKQTRDFIPVEDVATAIASSLKLPVERWDSRVINLGSGVSTSIKELAEIIHTIAKSTSVIVDAPPRPGDVLHSLADIKQASEFLNFIPSSNLSVKLEELLK